MTGPNQPLRLPIPLFDGRWIVLEAIWPLTEESWTHFMACLQVMRPGLVDPDPTGDHGEADEVTP